MIPPIGSTEDTTISLSKDYLLKKVVLQTATPLGHGFNLSYDNKIKLSLGEFEENAKLKEENLRLQSPEEFEDAFWSTLLEKEPKMYAIENDDTLFSENTKLWNLSKFTRSDSNMHVEVNVDYIFLYSSLKLSNSP